MMMETLCFDFPTNQPQLNAEIYALLEENATSMFGDKLFVRKYDYRQHRLHCWVQLDDFRDISKYQRAELRTNKMNLILLLDVAAKETPIHKNQMEID